MAHATLKLHPGVDQNRTIALNEAAISYSNLVRFIPDKEGLGLVQKLGGWTKFYSSNFDTTVRALWAWEDTNAMSHLAVGCETAESIITGLSASGTALTITYSGSRSYSVGSQVTISGVDPDKYNGNYTVATTAPGVITVASTDTGAVVSLGLLSSGESLFVITNGELTVLTPRFQDEDAAVSATTTAGSSTVVITAASSNLLTNDTVDIKTQISVGGIVLFGVYQATRVSSTQFSVVATNILGSPIAATSSVSNGGAVPDFSFTSGSPYVSVTLANHGYSTGSTFTILVPLTAGGLTLYGNYTVTSVTSSSIFVITAANTASSTTTAFLNGGNALYEYYRTPGPTPSATGYGVGGYGDGGYGVGSPGSGVVSNGFPVYADDWTLDNWGEILISCPVDGGIFEWSPSSGNTTSSIVPNSPTVNDGMFVAMPQRQIIAWGSTFTGIKDPLLIRWCDVNNFSSWNATVTNQAGSYRLPKGSRIVGCIQGPQQGLVWTDLACWAMQYSGPPYVYQFNEIGNGCGLIARKAAGSMNGIVYWMSQSQFYRLGGSGVEPISCPIWDVIFQDLDLNNLDKIRIAPNSRFGEVSWYYPTTTSGGEISNYVKYNVLLNQWDFGSLARTAWINQSVLGPPIGAGTTNYIYQHETSPDADGTPMNSSFQTGYFQMADAEYKVFVDQVWPDFKWGYYGGNQSATLLLTFYVNDYAGQTPKAYGPYTMTEATTYLTPRFRGRLMSIKVESNDLGSFWRIGAMRYRLEPDGKF